MILVHRLKGLKSKGGHRIYLVQGHHGEFEPGKDPFSFFFDRSFLILGGVHKLRLQEEGGRWSKKSNFCKFYTIENVNGGR